MLLCPAIIPPIPPAPLSAPAGTLREIEASLLDAPMQVCLRSDAQCTELRFADGTQARVAADGWQIDLLQEGAQVQAVLWGPLLLLALARHGIYCLHAAAYLWLDHASAVPGARLVLADSGVGKSTLARVAGAHGGLALLDDLSPLTLNVAGDPVVLPRFPQLKWLAAQHWPVQRGATLPLHRLGLLRRGDACALQAVDAAQLLRACVRHTVAACLFEPSLLRRHLLFCTALTLRLQQHAAALGWVVREAAVDPAGAMLELLTTIETCP